MTLESVMGTLAAVTPVLLFTVLGWLSWTGRLLVERGERGSVLNHTGAVMLPAGAIGIDFIVAGMVSAALVDGGDGLFFALMGAGVLISFVGWFAGLSGRPSFVVPPPLRPWPGLLALRRE